MPPQHPRPPQSCVSLQFCRKGQRSDFVALRRDLSGYYLKSASACLRHHRTLTGNGWEALKWDKL